MLLAIILALIAPANFHVTSTSGTSIATAWNTVSNAKKYLMFRDGVKVATLDAPVTKYTFSGLKCGTSYKLGVRARRGTSDSPTTVINASTQACTSPVLREDNASNPDPLPLWGSVDAADPSRAQQFSTGGPSDGAFRRLTVLDGDDFFGERAELGHNESRYGLASPTNPNGTFYLYNEGDRRVTSFWLRLPTDFPINTVNWQVVMQMKQTQPYVSASMSSPVLSMEADNGTWNLMSNGNFVWQGPPAMLGVWQHVTWDVTYSKNTGQVKMTVDGVSSPVFSIPTLATATAAGDGYNVGDPIPSHLRVGIYHNPVIQGTSVDIADIVVQETS